MVYFLNNPMAPLTFDRPPDEFNSARQKSLRLVDVAVIAEVLKHSNLEGSYSCIVPRRLTGPFVNFVLVGRRRSSKMQERWKR